jgi:predicted porin
VVLWAECESNCTNQTDQGEGFDDNQFSWAVGGLLEFGGFAFGAGYNRADDFAPETQDLDIVNVGLKYGFGDANVSFGYTFNGFDEEGLDDSHLFVLSGDIGILPGVTLLADVSYNTEDLGAFEGGVNGENEQDDTYGGVLSVQLDY